MKIHSQTLSVYVAKRVDIAADIVHFRLAAQAGALLPSASPGSHIDVHLPDGLIRQYSIFHIDHALEYYDIAVLLDPQSRGGSEYMHHELIQGAVLEISEPRNQFELSTLGKHHVLIAGGIGVTPILSMAEFLSANGQSFEVHYCARSQSRAAFFEHFSKCNYKNCVSIYLDTVADEPKIDVASILGAQKELLTTHLYVCGPSGFIDMVKAESIVQGLPEKQLHFERFSGAAEASSAEPSFELFLKRSGKRVQVSTGQTALEALIASGIDVPTSCGQGICGTCLVNVIEGEIDHRDHYLTEGEKKSNTCFLPCCSRAKSERLVLDL